MLKQHRVADYIYIHAQLNYAIPKVHNGPKRKKVFEICKQEEKQKQQQTTNPLNPKTIFENNKKKKA